MRVHELAKELGMTNQEVVDLCGVLGVPVKSHSSSLNEAYSDMVRRRAVRDGLTRDEQPEEPKPEKKAPAKKTAAAEVAARPSPARMPSPSRNPRPSRSPTSPRPVETPPAPTRRGRSSSAEPARRADAGT